jgi:putative salt-induced outer membrane protein
VETVLRYERAFSETWSLFLAQGVESDRFAGFMQKYNSDLGAKHFFRKAAALTWFGELGYRYSRERLLDSSHDNKQQARVYTEAQRAWNEAVSSKLWLEYLPNFTRWGDWELNGELSTSAALNSVLAMKVAYLAKFNHEPNPPARHQLDSLVTTSLVARY